MSLKSKSPSTYFRSFRKYVTGFILFLSLLSLPGCDFLKAKVEEFLFQFNGVDGSLDQIIVDGELAIDGLSTGISTSNIKELSISEEFVNLTFTIGNDTYYFKAQNDGNSSYDLVDNFISEATTFFSNFLKPTWGIGGVSYTEINASSTYEGSGVIRLVAVGDFQSNAGGSLTQIAFQMEIDFDTSRTGGLLGSGGGSGGGTDSGGSGSGSGSGSCPNEIKVPYLESYWGPQIKPVDLVVGTGKKVAGNTIFSDYKATDVGLVIDGTSGDTRYVIQILLTKENLVANKKVDFFNAGVGAGLTNAGAVGILYTKKGTLFDDWRTNRDFGENKDRGDLFIETVSPQIRGRYEFEAYGDGYDGKTNKQLARVSGRFCIDP